MAATQMSEATNNSSLLIWCICIGLAEGLLLT